MQEAALIFLARSWCLHEKSVEKYYTQHNKISKFHSVSPTLPQSTTPSETIISCEPNKVSQKTVCLSYRFFSIIIITIFFRGLFDNVFVWFFSSSLKKKKKESQGIKRKKRREGGWIRETRGNLLRLNRRASGVWIAGRGKASRMMYIH